MIPRQRLHPAIAVKYERALTADELAERAAIPRTREEDEDLLELVRWFKARYPTAKERFAYVNRKYREWTRVRPVAKP